MSLFKDVEEHQSSHHFISTIDSQVEVKVRLDQTNQPEFKSLMSLASSGEKPLAVDTEEVDRVVGGDNGGGASPTTRISRQAGGRGGGGRSRESSRQTNSRKSIL